MLSPNATFMSLSQIEKYIKQLELQSLNLDNEWVWSRAYLPALQMTNNLGVYEGCIKFHHTHIQLIFLNVPLLGCSPLPNWLCKIQFKYATENTDDSLCVWHCLIISERIRHNRGRPTERMTRDAFNLASEFCGNPNLHIHDVRPTKLIDFENIASRFQVNVRLFVFINQLVWKLVVEQVHDRRSLPSVDIDLCQGNCFYINYLDSLANHRECAECQQRFTHHDNCERHITKKTMYPWLT